MSHPGATPAYNITQQNGAAGGDSGRTARAAQYRRQGSSYGPGHVHNMAVMVPPTRVDYSVTKGGLRSWIVLLVFVLLCSTLLTIFSDDGSDNGNDGKWLSITDANENNDDESSVYGDIPLSDSCDDGKINVGDSDDENDDEEELEMAMLAKLKEKAVQHEKHRQPYQAQTIEKEADEKDDKDNDEECNEDNKDDNDEEDKEDADNNHIHEQKETKSKVIKHKGKITKDVLKKSTKGGNDVENRENEEDAKDEQELLQKRDKKVMKRQKRRTQRETQSYSKSWRDSSIQAQRLADDVKTPRKNLLKLKKIRKQNLENIVDENDNEDDDNDNDEHIVDDVKSDNEALISTKRVNDASVFEIVASHKRLPQYDRKAITNRDDFKVRAELDDADFRLEKHDFAGATAIYERILQNNPDSPRALYGKAYTLQLRSEFYDDTKSDGDSLIETAITLYKNVLDNDETPDELFRMAADNLVECARWIGNLHKVLYVQRALIDKFPEQIAYQNDFAITFLQMGRIEDARKVFSNVLETEPANSVAQSYYGYIFKVHDGDLEKGVLWMKKGLRSSHGSIHDPKFFFHLGDALTRLSREQEARKVYEEAVSLGLFPSVYQRSMHNLDGLTSRPWWTLDQTGCGKQLRHIERQWTIIREEAQTAWEQKQAIFQNTDSYLLNGVEMMVYLRKDWKFSKTECRTHFQNTCEILRKLIEDSSCGKDQIKISVLFARSRIWPHCAPTNYELEAHLGLVTPSEARIRVGQTTRGWKSGQFIVFDKSFEQETWFDGAAANALRIVLSVDLWHPQVPQEIRMHSHAHKRR